MKTETRITKTSDEEGGKYNLEIAGKIVLKDKDLTTIIEYLNWTTEDKPNGRS